jgi:flavin-dependent dehydrogenase
MATTQPALAETPAVPPPAAAERFDVVVVGARCAGSATAAMLAKADRRVLVIDRAGFPSDTLSTHAMFPAGLAEFKRIGAWERVRDRIKPARLDHVQIDIECGGVTARETWEPVMGIDFGASIPRDQLDVHLVENARDQGAEVRERCSLESVLWEHGRVVGITYRDADKRVHEIHADLVVGADGRRSPVAAQVGAWEPFRVSRNGRGLVFRYMDDPKVGSWESRTMWQWRDGDSFAFAFPNPKDRIICLFMGDASEVAEARSDPDGYWARKLAQHPAAAERLAGATNLSKLRSTDDVQAFWRASSGPGWVLAGDASHFKDPVTGQGMGDALRMGRSLGEAVAPLIGRPAELDRATRRWERATQEHCQHAYHFANFDTRVEPVSPVFAEFVREAGKDGGPTLSHIFGRTRHTEEIVTWPRMARALADALRRHPNRLQNLRFGIDFALMQHRIRRELASGRFRETNLVEGSDHPPREFWDPPRAPGGER